MSRENGVDTIFDPDRNKAEAIRGLLAAKQADYFKARRENRPDDADRIEQEYKDLLTEYRYTDPSADLSFEEWSLKEEAEDLTREQATKRKNEK